MRIKTRHVKTIYWLRSLRNTHTRKHSRNPGGDGSQASNKQLIVKTKRKPWTGLVMKLNFITTAWNFGFLESCQVVIPEELKQNYDKERITK